MKANKRTEWYNRPYHLTVDQLGNPMIVIDEFFSCYHLDDLRQLLWDWLQAAMATENSSFDCSRDRSNLLFLYKKIEELVEAVYVLREKINGGDEDKTAKA